MKTAKPTIQQIRKLADELNVVLGITQNSTTYGDISLHAPFWHCFSRSGDEHSIYIGWGEGQVCCNRQECYEEIAEILSLGLARCDCPTCCEEARAVYNLDGDMPDEIVRDYARDLGDLPMEF